MANFSIKGLLDLPVLASEHGADVDSFIIYVHWLMAVLFVGWFSYFVYTLFRFHESKNPRADYVGVKSKASSWIEGAVIVAELVLLLGFAIPLWAKVVDEFPDRKDAVEIHVIGQQFAWNFRYAGVDGVFGNQDPAFVTPLNQFGLDESDSYGTDDFKELNVMRVPVGKPIITQISSLDVIHSFAINPLRITQDAIPGMRIPTHFTATKEGKYLITCAQLCGGSHYAMKATLDVVSQEEYDAWLAEKAPVVEVDYE